MKTAAIPRSFAIIIFASVCSAPSFSSSTTTVDTQQLLQTIEKRDLTIELDRQQQLQTRAQLTLPAVGDGPFPAVLLIHGSGAADMDGYIPPELSGTSTGAINAAIIAGSKDEDSPGQLLEKFWLELSDSFV